MARIHDVQYLDCCYCPHLTLGDACGGRCDDNTRSKPSYVVVSDAVAWREDLDVVILDRVEIEELVQALGGRITWGEQK
jgi:hypothetical protein